MMRRMSLAMVGTTLTLPKFGRPVRLSMVNVLTTAQVITVSVLDGAGGVAFTTAPFLFGSNAQFAVMTDIGSGVAALPQDLWIEESDTVTVVAAAAITSDVIVSFEEKEGK